MNNQEPIIPPVDRNLIEKELTLDKFLRYTNYGKNHIYILDAFDSPHTMLEIGRLREISFRDAGGGTGKPYDIDEYDTMPTPYKQLIVWNPEEKEIIGGYRYIRLGDLQPNEKGIYPLATTKMFQFSEKFIQEYLPYTIELGRSFVQPRYQPAHNSRQGLFSLDNLWDGLGALTVLNPDIKYFFGKVTLYLNFDQMARDAILYFMMKFFPDTEQLVVPYNPRGYSHDISRLEVMFTASSYKENYRELQKFVRSRNESIPPLVSAYMGLSPTMKTFGAALNPEFGPVEEIGILITIADIYQSKKERYVKTYLRQKNS